MVELEIFTTVYLIRESPVTYKVGYVPHRFPHRQFQTLTSQ